MSTPNEIISNWKNICNKKRKLGHTNLPSLDEYTNYISAQQLIHDSKIKSKRKPWMTKTFINKKQKMINIYNKTYELSKQNTKKIKYNKSKTRKY
jgi:hypothetical protein